MSGFWEDVKGCAGCTCVGCCLIALLIGYAEDQRQRQRPISLNEYLRSPDTVVHTVHITGNDVVSRQILRYQREISPELRKLIGTNRICKYEPSCSNYALAAIEKHGVLIGSAKAIGRLARCNPLSRGGYDPVV